MNHLNNCLLLGKYHSIDIINDDIATLTIIVNDFDGDITIPVIIGTEVAYQIIEKCEENSMIGIKGKIDADEHGIIIKAEKLTFLSHEERAD